MRKNNTPPTKKVQPVPLVKLTPPKPQPAKAPMPLPPPKKTWIDWFNTKKTVDKCVIVGLPIALLGTLGTWIGVIEPLVARQTVPVVAPAKPPVIIHMKGPNGQTLDATIPAGESPIIIAPGWSAPSKILPSRNETPERFRYRQLYSSIVKSLKSGDSKGAAEYSTQAIAIDPKAAVAYNSRAIARALSGDLPGAISDWKSAVILDPVSNIYHENLAKALLNSSQTQPDPTVLLTQSLQEEALALTDPSNSIYVKSRIWTNTAYTYLLLKNYPMALQSVNKSLNYIPESSPAHSLKAQIFLVSRYPNSVHLAINELNKAIQIYPAGSKSYWTLAQIYAFQVHDLDKCYSNLKIAVEHDPSIRVNLQRPEWQKLCTDPRFRILINGPGLADKAPQ